MRKTARFFAFIFSCMIVISCLAINVFAINIPNATSDFYVNDFANILSKGQKDSLMNEAVALASKDEGVQVVVTIITSLDGEDINSYANKMYNNYGIGKDDKGILILLATKDRQIRMEVGRGLEQYITDSKAGNMLDTYAIPYLKRNDFANGIINLQTNVISKINDISFTEVITKQAVKDNDSFNEFSSDTFIFGFGIILIISSIAFFVLRLKKTKDKEIASQLEIKKLNDEISDLKLEKMNNYNSYCSLLNKKEIELDEYRLFKEKAIRCDRNIELKIQDMLTKEREQEDIIAVKRVNDIIIKFTQNFDRQYNDCKKLVAQYEKADSISEKYSIDCALAFEILVNYCLQILDAYESLTSDQIKLVNDISKIKEWYDDVSEKENKYRKERQALKFSLDISKIISDVSIAKARHLSKLKNLKGIYIGFDNNQKALINKELIERLDQLISQAKKDKENEDEEISRRNNEFNSYSSHTSNNSSFGENSSFSGFSGHSSGGGAGRGF